MTEIRETEETKASAAKPSFLRRVLFAIRFLEIRLRFVLILVITALVVGYWDHVQNYYERWQRDRHAVEKQAAAESDTEYYCGMHPFVVRDRAGKCPICGMDLSPRKKGPASALPEGVVARVQASPERIMQAGVDTQPVAYHFLVSEIRSYGVIEPIEGRRARITARFPGRIEELLVTSVGASVKKGEPLAKIYSPKFLAASDEYLRALGNQQRAASAPNPDPSQAVDQKATADQFAAAARRRLLLAGFTEEQLALVAQTGTPSNTVTLYSPLSGAVVEKSALQGDTVEESTALYTIADLSALWVQVKVVEADIAGVKTGMPVEVTSVAWPGRIFYGTVDLIYPILDTNSRTVNVRVTVGNPDGALRPGMYVNAILRAPVGKFEAANAKAPQQASAKAAATLPTSKQEDADHFVMGLADGAEYFICPMHANVVGDKPADCPLCGMPLVKTKKGGKPEVKTSAPALPTQAKADADAFVGALPGAAEYYECPMHPEVVSDKPTDKCPLCNMALEKKKKEAPPVDLTAPSTSDAVVEGYACAMHPNELSPAPGVCRTCNCGMPMTKWRAERVLAVPESAVIDTGRRKLVYVEAMPGVYDAHEVQLGARVGGYYPVLQGLATGDKVVGHGAFLIDAEARLNPTITGYAK